LEKKSFGRGIEIEKGLYDIVSQLNCIFKNGKHTIRSLTVFKRVTTRRVVTHHGSLRTITGHKPVASFELLFSKGYKILEAKVMPDHIHLFIEANPFDSSTNIVKIFKGVIALRMDRKFPDLVRSRRNSHRSRPRETLITI
jgi:hypothetical protein